MYKSTKYQFIYLAHPRTASIATANAIAGKCIPGTEIAGAHHHDSLGREWSNKEWVVMTTVRNPFDTLTSWHCYTKKDSPLDIDYIYWLFAYDPPSPAPGSTRAMRNSRYFPTWGKLWGLHCPWATHILRYETLAVDLNAALADAGARPVKIPLTNVSKFRNGTRYQDVIDPKTRAFIEREFGEEMEELDYHW